MLEFVNQTDWSGGLYPGWDRDRKLQFTAVFKAGFEFDTWGKLVPMESCPPVVEADEHFGVPHETSLRAAAEIAPFKGQSEVYLFGTAHPPPGSAVAMEVGMGLDFRDGETWEKTLRIYGPRNWKKLMFNHVMGKPGALEPTPLRYEYAFGGQNPNNEDECWMLNPVGMGYNATAWKMANAELPRIEVGPRFITSPANRPFPGGFGPLPVFWEPRASERGEPVEDSGAHGGCPFSAQAAPTLHNAAPPDQRFDKPFSGGEVLELRSLLPGESGQRVQITLPTLKPRVVCIVDNNTEQLEPVCDTLIVDTDARQICMVYRAGIPWRLLDRRKGWVVLSDGVSAATGSGGRSEGPALTVRA